MRVLEPRIIVVCLLGLVLWACKPKELINETREQKEISYSTYSEDWEQVQVLEEKGLGKTIIDKTNQILQKALRENNLNQIFKSIAYRSKYINQIEEEAEYKILKDFEEQIAIAAPPLKQLLHSAMAELYEQYYQQGQYRIGKRSETSNFDLADIRSWSLQRIKEQIDFHYKSSLEQEEDLKQLSTSLLEPILLPIDSDSNFRINSYDLRPFLYDLLLDRALSYYKQNKGQLGKAFFEGFINQQSLFGTVPEFLSSSFDSTHFAVKEWQTLLLYKKILRIHKNDKDPKVLIDFNLQRLRNFYTISQSSEKDSLYLKALTAFAKKYQKHDMHDEIKFQIATLHHQWGSAYHSSAHSEHDEDTRWYLREAHQLCSSIKHNSTLGARQARALIQRIEASYINFQLEKVYLPNKPILFRLQYKNVDSVYFRIVKLPFEPFNKHEYHHRELLSEKLLSRKPIRTWKQVVENPGDFHEHSTELYTDALDNGNYYLIASIDSVFNKTQTEHIAYANFSISNLSFFSRADHRKGQLEINVRNRNNGLVNSTTKINLFQYHYDKMNRINDWKFLKSYALNSEGNVSINNAGDRSNYRFYLVNQNDTLIPYANFYINKHKLSNRTVIKTHFFTDRAIYRPGQVIQFKGLIIESDQNTKKLKTNHNTEVKLYNTNGELLNSKKLTTNDYGSYEGSFILPSKGLNGKYRIQDQHGMHYFYVEEYKRPTFKINIDSSDAQQKLNEPIQVSGQIKAYSGETISNTEISYKVLRRQYQLYWSYWYRPPVTDEEQIITSGKIKSSADGSFAFEFIPTTNATSSNGYYPSYSFEVIIDASILSGETQSIRKDIRLSQQALFLDGKLDRGIELQDLKAFILNATNINGKQIDAKATLSLFKLKTPETIVIPRLWAKTDVHIIPENTFKEHFPNYQISVENEIEKFKKDYLVSNANIVCNQAIDLFKSIQPGAYELEAQTKDKYGNKIEWKRRFILFDPNSKALPYPMFSWFKAISTEGEPGDKAQFILGSSLKNLEVLYELVYDNQIVAKEWIQLNKEQRLIEVPIQKRFRGDFKVQFTAVHSNRSIQHSANVKVPFSNKKLHLHLSSYRKVMEPGSYEKWEIQINDSSKNSEAEVLLGMYDESLDQFRTNDWRLNLYRSKRAGMVWSFHGNFSMLNAQLIYSRRKPMLPIVGRIYPQLNWFGLYLNRGYYGYYRNGAIPMMASDDAEVMEQERSLADGNAMKVDKKEAKYVTKEETQKTSSINPVRKDFRETALFFPQLKINKDGIRTFEFQMPEALTSWKFRAMAHTKDLKVGYLERTVQTQKKLMIKPNYPRFLRQGDTIDLKALIHNLSGSPISGHARLEILDVESERRLDFFVGASSDQRFKIYDKQNQVVGWKITIPEHLNINAVTFRFKATNEKYGDGEEKTIAVLSNRMLVTESLPMSVQAKETGNFSFDKLLASENSKTLRHRSFSLEFTPNPAWYAVQALPMIAKSGEENAEQLFSRFYANSIAYHIANSQPRIRSIFNQWSQLQPDALNSKLLQNQDLKNMLIEETPWLQMAKNETEQKRRIALLFDFNRMSNERQEALEKLGALQLPEGAWPWFKGMRANRYMTQYILEGLGKMRHMGVDSDSKSREMIKKALLYLDLEIANDYKKLLEKKLDLSKNHLQNRHIHYLYLRSFYDDYSSISQKEAQKYFIKQAEAYWKDRNNYMKGMIALSLHRLKQNNLVPALIVNSLKDNAIEDKDLGMYWKMNRASYWYQAPVETQALMIEVFDELSSDQKSVEEMKVWLLKQKQISAWTNSKATAMACYALLMKGENLLTGSSDASIFIGEEELKVKDQETEAGSNYFRKTWNAESVKTELGKIVIKNTGPSIAWGAAHWQFMEDIDRIKEADVTELELSKSYFRREINDGKEIIRPLGENLKVGETVVVRLRLESKRDLEFVSLKDMRPAAFEPTTTISGRRYQDGLTYYQSTKDASSNFYFDWLPKGVYIFEYELKVNQTGNFSAGIAQLQSYYAPEFSSHSSGEMIKIID